MEPFHYLLVLAGCVLITLPLEFVFNARVYRRPVATGAAIGVVVVVFGLWDIVAIARDHWSYSPRFTVGVVLPGGVPIEELLFFVVVPLCALLSYEAIGTALGWIRQRRGSIGSRPTGPRPSVIDRERRDS